MQSKELLTNISELLQKSLESIEKGHCLRLNKSRIDFIELVV